MSVSSECRQLDDKYQKVSSAKCRQENRVATCTYDVGDILTTNTNIPSPVLTTDWGLFRRAPMCRQGPQSHYWPLKKIVPPRLPTAVNELDREASTARGWREHLQVPVHNPVPRSLRIAAHHQCGVSSDSVVMDNRARCTLPAAPSTGYRVHRGRQHPIIYALRFRCDACACLPSQPQGVELCL